MGFDKQELMLGQFDSSIRPRPRNMIALFNLVPPEIWVEVMLNLQEKGIWRGDEWNKFYKNMVKIYLSYLKKPLTGNNKILAGHTVANAIQKAMSHILANVLVEKEKEEIQLYRWALALHYSITDMPWSASKAPRIWSSKTPFPILKNLIPTIHLCSHSVDRYVTTYTAEKKLTISKKQLIEKIGEDASIIEAFKKNMEIEGYLKRLSLSRSVYRAHIFSKALRQFIVNSNLRYYIICLLPTMFFISFTYRVITKLGLDLLAQYLFFSGFISFASIVSPIILLSIFLLILGYLERIFLGSKTFIEALERFLENNKNLLACASSFLYTTVFCTTLIYNVITRLGFGLVHDLLFSLDIGFASLACPIILLSPFLLTLVCLERIIKKRLDSSMDEQQVSDALDALKLMLKYILKTQIDNLGIEVLNAKPELADVLQDRANIEFLMKVDDRLPSLQEVIVDDYSVDTFNDESTGLIAPVSNNQAGFVQRIGQWFSFFATPAPVKFNSLLIEEGESESAIVPTETRYIIHTRQYGTTTV